MQYEYTLNVFNDRISPDPSFDLRNHSMYCCIAYFNAFNEEWPVYRAEIGGSALYYSLDDKKKRVKVLGTLNHYSREEIDIFCAFLFDRYPIRYIDWGGFYEPYTSAKYQVHKTAIVSDIVMDLPADEKGYLAMLNSTTRKHVQYYKRRFLKTFPEAKLGVYRKEEISEELVRELIRFNHLRMEEKNSHSDLDEKDEKGMYALCREHGVIHTVEKDGVLLGGTIDPQIGRHGHLAVIAHDPAYNKYNIGQIALYETIADSIRDGCEQFHFLWDMSDYKKRFGGQLVELYYYHIYPKNSLAGAADGLKCRAVCSAMYFQKRSPAGRRIINKVKSVIGMK